MTAQYVVVQFIGSNTYTRSDHHGNPIIYTEEQLKEHAITHILRTQTNIDDADEDEWYAMDTELLEETYGVTL